MEDQILKIIQTIGNNGEHVGPDQELLESGILDSLAFIMLLRRFLTDGELRFSPPRCRWRYGKCSLHCQYGRKGR